LATVKAVGLGEGDGFGVVFGGGTKLRGELFDGQEQSVAGTGRVVELVEQVIELGFVAQG
jgi:hypothetical protein